MWKQAKSGDCLNRSCGGQCRGAFDRYDRERRRSITECPGDVGSCEVGHYKVDGDMLTLVDAGGVPVRTNSGERITAHLLAGDEARRVASRLTLAHWRNQRAQNELVLGFNDPLHYPRAGWA
jgi:hypothetical protein